MVECKLCGREFNSEAGLVQHHKVKHPNEPLPQSGSLKDQVRKEEEELIPKRRGGIRRNLESRKKRRRMVVVAVALAIVAGSGLGGYSIYNITAHPGAPYGSFPFPCSGSVAVHIHPYVRIEIGGSNVTIPADIGITSCLEPLHTHDASGIIHLESSDANTQYTLGDFFQIWKDTYGTISIDGASHPIVFNSTDILGFRADSTHKVVLLVDGKPSTDYGSLVLNSLDYCSAATTGPPCSPTAVGDPFYGSQAYPYGTGHTIVIEYIASG